MVRVFVVCLICLHLRMLLTNEAVMSEKKHFTVKELAEALRVSQNTIRNHIKSGGIKAHMHFGKYLIPADELERLKVPE